MYLIETTVVELCIYIVLVHDYACILYNNNYDICLPVRNDVCTLRCLTLYYRYLSNCSFHSVIYRGSDLDLSTVKGAVCGAAHEDVQQEMLKTQMLLGAEHKQRLRKRQTTNTNRDAAKVRCWLNVIGDYKYVTSVGGASTAMGLLINIIQQVNVQYIYCILHVHVYGTTACS